MDPPRTAESIGLELAALRVEHALQANQCVGVRLETTIGWLIALAWAAGIRRVVSRPPRRRPFLTHLRVEGARRARPAPRGARGFTT